MHPHRHEGKSEQRNKEAVERLREAGYAAGGGTRVEQEHETKPRAAGGRLHSEAGEEERDEKKDAKMVASGVHQHEAKLHKGEQKTKLKLKGGGEVKGEEPAPNLGKRARGGRMPKGHQTNVIIHAGAGQQEKQQAAMQGMKIGAAMGARRAAAGMMGGPGAGAPPAPGAAPRLPIAPPGQPTMGPPPMGGAPGMMPRARGGGVGHDVVKIRAHTRRKAGGAV